MRKTLPFLAFLFLLCPLSSVFALSDSEYRILLATSQEFRNADQELQRTWNEVYREVKGSYKKKALAGQRQWLKVERDAAAKKFMETGTSKEESYAEAVRNRIDALRVLQFQFREEQAEKKLPKN